MPSLHNRDTQRAVQEHSRCCCSHETGEARARYQPVHPYLTYAGESVMFRSGTRVDCARNSAQRPEGRSPAPERRRGNNRCSGCEASSLVVVFHLNFRVQLPTVVRHDRYSTLPLPPQFFPLQNAQLLNHLYRIYSRGPQEILPEKRRWHSIKRKKCHKNERYATRRAGLQEAAAKGKKTSAR